VALWSEFKEFIRKGDVIALAVAFVIGLAFNAVVQAFVADLVTPLIGVFFHANFSAITVTINGSTFLTGDFVNKIISFLIVAAVVFFLIVKPLAMMEVRRKAAQGTPAPTTRACPECLSQIPLAARRCSFCTSPVSPVPASA
jgi:large conductance mechanosensitive channel